jgi:hypothetical protein
MGSFGGMTPPNERPEDDEDLDHDPERDPRITTTDYQDEANEQAENLDGDDGAA